MGIVHHSFGTKGRWTDQSSANTASRSQSNGSMSRERAFSPKQSKHKKAMQRSKSTPDVRAISDAEGSLADKKRNKLGYHRTAVACGHCRRRKIRCVIAVDDHTANPTARCQNCIRLKKDCHFYPVDQQPPIVKRSRSGPKVDASTNDPETSISSSSPGLAGNLGGQIDGYPGNQVDPLSLSQEEQHYHSVIMRDRGILPSNGGEYSHDSHLHSLNPTPFLSHSPPPYDRQPFDSHHSYWQSGQHSHPSYSNVPMAPSSATLPHPSQDPAQSFSIPISRAEFAWQPPHPPMRSISAGGPVENQYQRFYPEPTAPIQRSSTSSSEMHNMAAGLAGTHVGSQLPRTHSQSNILSFEEQNQPHLTQHAYQNPWHSLPTSQVSQIAGPGHSQGAQGWYAPSPALPHVKEEEFYQRPQPP